MGSKTYLKVQFFINIFVCSRYLITLQEMTKPMDRKSSVAFNHVMEEIEIEEFRQFRTEDESQKSDLTEEVGPFTTRQPRLSVFSHFSVNTLHSMYSTYQYGFLIVTFCLVFTMGLVIGVFLHMFFLCKPCEPD